MKNYTYSTLDRAQIRELVKRPKMDFVSLFSTVQPILDEVEQKGDDAVKKYTSKFDGVDLKHVTLDPATSEVVLADDIRVALDVAFENIRTFHEAQTPESTEVETMSGVRCRQEYRPISNVGLYVPGGTAVLPSTAMMLCIPAMIAGCEQIVLSTPPRPDGSIAPEILYIAKKAGVDQIVLAGGAQAIAAMAFGTDSVIKTDKIFGPGNQYVTAAKMILQNSEAQISIDMPAGPSEVLVIADEQADPAFVAADLLSQAEHGADSQVVLVSVAGFDLDSLKEKLSDQLDQLPRKEMASAAIKNSYVVETEDLDQAFEFSNAYAPEHLIINIREAATYTDRIQHAGSVFIGNYTPESVGDYASGTNHTLPTYGYARMYSGVNLRSFLKSVTMQELTKEGLRKLGPYVEKLAETEGLHAHKRAVSIRLEHIRSES